MARPRVPKIADNAPLRSEAERLLTDLWSPQQISMHIEGAYPDDEGIRISHECVYRALFVQGFRMELSTCLRSGRASWR